MNKVKKFRIASLAVAALLVLTMALTTVFFEKNTLINASASQEVGRFEQTNVVSTMYTLDDNFCDNSFIVTLDEDTSSFRGVSKQLSNRLFEGIAVKSIRDLTEMPESFLNPNGSISAITVPAMAEHFSKTSFNQILYVELEKNSKQNVLDCINQIKNRAGIKLVSPNIFETVNTSANASISFVSTSANALEDEYTATIDEFNNYVNVEPFASGKDREEPERII